MRQSAAPIWPTRVFRPRHGAGCDRPRSIHERALLPSHNRDTGSARPRWLGMDHWWSIEHALPPSDSSHISCIERKYAYRSNQPQDFLGTSRTTLAAAFESPNAPNAHAQPRRLARPTTDKHCITTAYVDLNGTTEYSRLRLCAERVDRSRVSPTEGALAVLPARAGCALVAFSPHFTKGGLVSRHTQRRDQVSRAN